ncbi:lipoxygenase [Mycena maculata]|uniref:Manganese lipoxygenase n=1 Tax=Mycena maculata TaxID=230809 RepID=A0AAD7K8G4_9AGAR|nr:lipoxygenase [Mycena maculata]
MDPHIDSLYYSWDSASGLNGYQDDVVIAVMGSTGTGKSSFVKFITGNSSIVVGNGLESETIDVQTFRVRDPASGRKLTIVDTPGFDDSRAGITDTEVLKKIADFLVEEYDSDRKLNGLVYLQRISDPRFGGQAGRNLKMFRKLCGSDSFKNVVVLTTFWDRLADEQQGSRREKELKSKFFKDLVDGGAHFMRHDRTIDSVRKVLGHIFALIPTNVQIQEEICLDGKSLEDTAAGSVRREEVEQIMARHEKEVTGIRAEMETIKRSNEKARRELEEERDKLQQELVRWQSEISVLKKGLDDEKKWREQLQAEVVKELKRQEESRKNDAKIKVMDNPPDGHSAQPVFRGTKDSNLYKFAHSERYPPHLKHIPWKYQTNIFHIFDALALIQTKALLIGGQSMICQPLMRRRAHLHTASAMQDLVTRNHDLHKKSQRKGLRDMYFKPNIGHRDDWYTDAVFGQQQFTGTNPSTITLAPPRWIHEFGTASCIQHRADIMQLLTDDPQNFFVQDCSDFRSIMGVSSSAEFASEARYGCSSVALFHLEPQGTLHPLAITLDYKANMEDSVTIFNRRVTSTTPGDESEDWPWRYAKMSAQVSDWLRHEVAVHLVNTHLVEEVIIVAAHRTFEPYHIVFQLLEPHWSTTLVLNKSARETLVPKVIIGMTGFTASQTYAFLKDAYKKFEWTDSYVPNDLRRRGFPIEDLNKSKYHNYGYARNIAGMWEILRKFVSTVLAEKYVGDAHVANDRFIAALGEEIRSHTKGQLVSFPHIKTLDELIDFVTMCIHIASPQHTAVNYLQQYYQTFVPNKPSALYTRLPRSLAELQNLTEKDVLSALPIHKPRDWLLMAQVPFLLSSEVSEGNTIFHYATTTSQSSSTPEVIRRAAGVLKDDLEAFARTVSKYSQELDDEQTPYLVLDPSRSAISILI